MWDIINLIIDDFLKNIYVFVFYLVLALRSFLWAQRAGATFQLQRKGFWLRLRLWLQSPAPGRVGFRRRATWAETWSPTSSAIFPNQGSNLCPPASQGGFLTPGPPGKPLLHSFQTRRNFVFPPHIASWNGHYIHWKRCSFHLITLLYPSSGL